MRKNINLYITYTLINISVKFIGYITLLLLAQKLSVSEYSKFGLLYSLQTIIISFSIAGILETSIGYINHYKKNANMISLTNVVFFINFIVIFSITIFYNLIKHKDIQYICMMLLVILISFFLSFFMYYSQIMRLFEQYMEALYLYSLPLLLFYIFGTIGIFIRDSLTYFYISAFLGIFFIFFLFLHLGMIKFNVEFSLKEIKIFYISAFPFFIITLFGWLNGYGINYIIDIFLEKTEIAKFTFLFTIASILQLIATSLNQIWAPKIYNMLSYLSIKEIEKKNYLFFFLTSLILAVVGGIIIFLLPLLSTYLKGSIHTYSKNTLELLILFIGYIFSIPWWHVSNYFYYYKKGYLLMKLNIINGLLGVLILIFTIKLFGSLGIYLSFLIRNLLLSLISLFVARKFWEVRFTLISSFIGAIIVIMIYWIIG